MLENLSASGASSESDILFTVADPLGNIVSLYREDYSHAQQHEEITSPEIIRQSIENPDVIRIDKEWKHRYNYYRKHGDDSLKEYGELVKVPVDFSAGTLAGYVVTAYCKDEVSPGEKPLWTK